MGIRNTASIFREPADPVGPNSIASNLAALTSPTPAAPAPIIAPVQGPAQQPAAPTYGNDVIQAAQNHGLTPAQVQAMVDSGNYSISYNPGDGGAESGVTTPESWSLQPTNPTALWASKLGMTMDQVNQLNSTPDGQAQWNSMVTQAEDQQAHAEDGPLGLPAGLTDALVLGGSAVLGPEIAELAGGGALGGAAAGATIGGGATAIKGGDLSDIGKGALTGGVVGGITGAVGDYFGAPATTTNTPPLQVADTGLTTTDVTPGLSTDGSGIDAEDAGYGTQAQTNVDQVNNPTQVATGGSQTYFPTDSEDAAGGTAMNDYAKTQGTNFGDPSTGTGLWQGNTFTGNNGGNPVPFGDKGDLNPDGTPVNPDTSAAGDQTTTTNDDQTKDQSTGNTNTDPNADPNTNTGGGTSTGGGITTTDLLLGGGLITGLVGGGNTDPGPDPNQAARDAEADRLRRAGLARGKIEDAFGQYGDDYYGSIAKNFVDHYAPDLNEQYDELARKALYAAPGGVGSSEFARQTGKIEKTRGEDLSDLSGRGEAAANDVRGALAKQKSDLISQADAAQDPEAIGEQAVSLAQSAARPAPYSPIADLFNRFTALAANTAISSAPPPIQGAGSGYYIPPDLLFNGSGGGGSSGNSDVPSVRTIR